MDDVGVSGSRSIGWARRIAFLSCGAVVALAAAWYLRHALLILYISSVFATVLKPAVDGIHGMTLLGWRPSRGAALVGLALVLLLAVAAVAALMVPPIASDISDFAATLPQKADRLRTWAQSVPLIRSLDFSAIQSRLVSAAPKIVPVIGNAGAILADAVTVVLLTAYLILDGARLTASLLRLVRGPLRSRWESILNRTARRMRGWLFGQFLLMLILGGSTTVALGLMRVPYFYLLGLFAGVANIIPLLGPIATLLLAGLVAAADSPWKALGVLIFYMAYQQVENAFLTPRIMKSQVQLSSATVLIALLIGGELAGIAGALVAVPSAVFVTEIADAYLEDDAENRE